jgi:hypothetical protein
MGHELSALRSEVSGPALSRVHSIGYAGASEARVLDRVVSVSPIMLQSLQLH